VRELVADHIALNAKRRSSMQQIHSNNGYQDRIDPQAFYPIPRNPKDTPHFAFVVDESISGRGHSKMIYAKDAKTLEEMRNKIMADPDLRGRGLTVLTKGESEQYYKSIGQYEYERTLSDNYINNALARKGVSSSFIPLTDPDRIVNSTLNWHLERDVALVRNAVEHRYANEFATLRAYAEPSLNAAKSTAGYSAAAANLDNPATNLIKTALNISKIDEYPIWSPLNKFLDSAYSNFVTKIETAFSSATSTAHLGAVNDALRKAGYQDVIVDSMLYEATNGVVPRGKLSSIVSKAHNILSMFALRTDPFNALNNAVGHAVLLGPEVKYVIDNIIAKNADAIGELKALGHIVVPGGSGSTQLSAAKLIGNRLKKFHGDAAGREWAAKHGFISTVSRQYDQAIDDLGIALAKGDETRLSKAFDAIKAIGGKAERWSGNALAEEMNRYVASGVMKDITDIAVKHGLMDEGTALAYINTFVNRTQGNYLASQRPGLFQGPLGQAIGLFQTYQFNLLQQLFRRIGEGDKKNLLLMAGLQGGIYGLNGMPAFNAINTHIIGNAGGNISHLTGYDAVMSGAGKEAGEWLLYGDSVMDWDYSILI
jgi:hypothetical protein